MSLIKVTSEDLESLSVNVASGSESIQNQLSKLHSDVARVVGADWRGLASGAFNTKYEEWHRCAAGLKDALDGISQLLAQAAIKYQETEDGIRSMWAA